MYDLTPIRTDGMNIRADHRVDSEDKGDLNYGQHATGTLIYTVQVNGEAKDAKAGDKWLQITSPQVGWVAIVHDGVELSIVTDGGAIPEDEYILHVKNGVTRKFIPE